jgi:hypothetical protein
MTDDTCNCGCGATTVVVEQPANTCNCGCCGPTTNPDEPSEPDTTH